MSDEPQAVDQVDALGQLWNSTVFVWDYLFREGHYTDHGGEGYCEWCEMWQEMDRAIGAAFDHVEAAGYEPRGYGPQRVVRLSEAARDTVILWDNPDADTKCQAMCGVDKNPDVYREVVDLLSRRWPQEATAFEANLERHRAETYLWGCRSEVGHGADEAAVRRSQPAPAEDADAEAERASPAASDGAVAAAGGLAR